MAHASVADAVWAALALLILGARFAWTLMRDGESRQAIELRQSWVRRVLATPGSEILAIQTVRNSIMAATLMATTAALALMGVISIGYGQLGAVAQFQPQCGVPPASAVPASACLMTGGINVTLMLPLTLLAACVVLFSKAVRLYHRTGYALGLPHGSSAGSGTAAAAAEIAAVRELTRAASLYRSGWRVLYAAIATGAGLAGAGMMLAATVIVVGIDVAARVE